MVLARAYGLLAKRPLFEAELREKLLAEHFTPEAVKAAIARLKQQGVLNDERLKTDLVQKNTGRKVVSGEMFLKKLRARGAPESEVDTDDLRAIQDLLCLRFPKDGTPKDKAKAARFLVSRGFGYDQIEIGIEGYFSE